VRDEELAKRLVVRRGEDGRCTYDEGAKRELIERCLQSGESVARTARDYGVNANQLHNWIGLYRKRFGNLLPSAATNIPRERIPAFIPVVTVKPGESSATAGELRLSVTLANGIQAELSRLKLNELLAILPVLSGLSCSDSTPN
jgi:transposase